MAINDAKMQYDRMKEVKEFDESKIGVKGLADSGVSYIPRFFVHPSESLTGFIPSSASINAVPVVSLSGSHSDRRREVVREIREAARTWGFFQVIDHGIHELILNQTIAAIKSFHEQPVEIKKQFYRRDERCNVLYAPNLDLTRSKAASWGDTIYVRLGSNPSELDRVPAVCRKEVVAWAEHVKELAETLMELLCEGLGVRPGKLKELRCLERMAVVGHYYPHCPQPHLTMGIPSHTDPSVLSVLLQNQIEGLQVRHGEDWVGVKPLPGALVINIGDFLQILSNDEYKSSVHRVIGNRFWEPRTTVATFFNASHRDDSEYYGPLEELLSPERPAVYRKFLISEFKNKFFSKELADNHLVDHFKL
ncbi:PREDICTED: 1-aminocyclopropane-1-carboxylate oxidase homolog 4-like [Nelumbo nucifera]|uniref:1-aminocyclopropane-1-carboxylate oxidase homolog 4-like n=2 Tax=Nelumbo nucifera TaxID=4432 RepID=A0A1U7Z100_NELNU|nr:PREDICTED: 1-aminocyclopropane-1-carboxylate oxidase homolog 4-like [Nelumbo nucifera]DAD48489.1 TPA_asm: hypothetical protein HUJ06_018427 [Nelumbo nucifera]